MVAFVTIGLVGDRFGGYKHAAVVAVAAAMTALYLLFANRFM